MNSAERNTSEFLHQMRDCGHPVVLTINGKAELVVQDAASDQRLFNRMDELEELEGIKRGVADVEAGRVTPLKEFEKEFRKKRGLPSRPRRFGEGRCGLHLRLGNSSGSCSWS
jgi:hypothetical protein